jgi:hypothetical protein
VARMGQTAPLVQPPILPTAGQAARVRWLILLSGVFLAVQVSEAEYTAVSGGPPAGVFWFAVGCFLLWLVYGVRSRFARGLVVVTSLFGAVVYGLPVPGDAHAALLAVAFLGQALPLLAGPVRRHVHSGT